MNYRDLKAKDAKTLESPRQIAQVDPKTLSKKDQLAYWINVYNVTVVSHRRALPGQVDPRHLDRPHHPPQRLQEGLPCRRQGPISLDTVENEKIRNGFHDPRIHFAINCAAKSCPPIRTEPYVGDQGRRAAGRPGAALPHRTAGGMEKRGEDVVVHVTKITDWFGRLR